MYGNPNQGGWVLSKEKDYGNDPALLAWTALLMDIAVSLGDWTEWWYRRCELQMSFYFSVWVFIVLSVYCLFLEMTLMSHVIFSLDMFLHTVDTSCVLLGSSAIALKLSCWRKTFYANQSLITVLNLWSLICSLWSFGSPLACVFGTICHNPSF